MKRTIVVEMFATLTTAAFAVAAFLVGALLVRMVWEGILLGWTVFGYWP